LEVSTLLSIVVLEEVSLREAAATMMEFPKPGFLLKDRNKGEIENEQDPTINIRLTNKAEITESMFWVMRVPTIAHLSNSLYLL
jgi:hypothetical protein